MHHGNRRAAYFRRPPTHPTPLRGTHGSAFLGRSGVSMPNLQRLFYIRAKVWHRLGIVKRFLSTGSTPPRLPRAFPCTTCWPRIHVKIWDSACCIPGVSKKSYAKTPTSCLVRIISKKSALKLDLLAELQHFAIRPSLKTKEDKRLSGKGCGILHNQCAFGSSGAAARLSVS